MSLIAYSGHPLTGMTYKIPQTGENACPLPAANTTGESLAALAGGGQGEGAINVDDLVHCALSEVFGKLHEDSGFSIAAANKAIYQSLDRLGYLERGK